MSEREPFHDDCGELCVLHRTVLRYSRNGKWVVVACRCKPEKR